MFACGYRRDRRLVELFSTTTQTWGGSDRDCRFDSLEINERLNNHYNSIKSERASTKKIDKTNVWVV